MTALMFSAFPGGGRRAEVPVPGADTGLRLRPADGRDLDFLRALHRSFRAAEMAPVPWPQAAKDAFLDDQFRLQHEHFTKVYASADFMVVEHGETAVGRLYLERRAEAFLVVDIGVLPDRRGQGLGRALMAWIAEEARAAGVPKVELHVLPNNTPARRLYEGLGFERVGAESGHLRMEWRLS